MISVGPHVSLFNGFSVGRSHFQSVPLFFPACTADMIMDMKDKSVEEVVDQVVMKVVNKITKEFVVGGHIAFTNGVKV